MIKNPYKSLSKISPQLEKWRGDRRLANDVYHALILARLTGVKYQICLLIIEKTWGFGKMSDTISASQFVEVCGCSERQIWNALKELKECRIIHYEAGEKGGRGSPQNKYLFNKYYDTWTVFKYLGMNVPDVVKSCLQLVSNNAQGCKILPTRVKNITPPYKDLKSNYSKESAVIESLITENLKRIATATKIVGVLKQLDAKQWWRVEKFLRQRYPEDGQAQYHKATDAIEVRAQAVGE